MTTDKLESPDFDRFTQTALTPDPDLEFDDDFDADATMIGDMGGFAAQEHSLLLKNSVQDTQVDVYPVIIGRDPQNSLSLPSKQVSRYHAAVYKFGKHYFLKDLHSTNGSVLNQNRVTQAVIRPGDQIRLGDQLLTVQRGPMISQGPSSHCVIVFLDLENSTQFAEVHGEAFTATIQEQFAQLEDRVLIHLGYTLKNLGDGLMCVFGLWSVPDPDYSAADHAYAFAREAVKQMARVKAFPHLRLRVGLHYGEVMVREDDGVDVFGDAVNLASRLEYANKLYQTHIIMSSAFYQKLQKPLALRELDTVRVQGKSEPVTLYTWDLVATKHLSNDYLNLYQEGLKLYRQGNFQTALRLFEQGVLQFKDPLAKALYTRTQSLLTSGLPNESWDGIWYIDKG